MFKRKPKAAPAQNMADGLTAEPSETRLRQIVIALILIVLPPLLLFGYFKLMTRGLINADAMDLAQVGRNLMQGHGWSTYILRPLNVDLGGDLTRQPDLTHGPLYPLLLALAFAPLGVKDNVVLGVSGLFYLATVPVLYLLGTRVFNRTIGVLAAIIFAVNHNMLEYATSGLPITLFTFLLTTLSLVIYNIAADARNVNPAMQNRAPRGQLILAGVLMAALYLAEPMLALVIPLAYGMVIWLSAKNRAAAALYAGIPFLLLAGPWMARNAMLAGNPVYGARGLEVWMNTSVYPNYSIYRMFKNEVTASPDLFRAIMSKLQMSVGAFIESTPNMPLAWVLAFFLPAMLIRYADPATAALRKLMAMGFLAMILTNLLFTPYATLYVAFVPTMLVFALSLIAVLLQQSQAPRGTVATTCGLLGLVIVYPLYNTVFVQPRPQPVRQRALAGFFASPTISKPDDVVVSDQPWLVAWYSARPSLWIPQTDQRLADVKRKMGKRMRYLFLTSSTSDSNVYPASWALLHSIGSTWNNSVYEWDRYIKVAKPKKSPPAPPPIMIGQVDDALRQRGVTTPFWLSDPLKDFRTFRVDIADRSNIDTVLAVDQTVAPDRPKPKTASAGRAQSASASR